MASATLSISAVWDRTTQHIGRQGGRLALLALATLGANDLLSAVLQTMLPGLSPLLRGLGVVVLLAGVLWAMLGQIAITSLALGRESAPVPALGNGLSRMPAMIGGALLLAAATVIAALPLVGAFVAGAVNLTTTPPEIAPWFVLYLLAFVILGLCVIARLVLIGPLIVDGAGPIAAIRASFVQTRGWFWRILAVMILYLIVTGVAVLATQSGFGILFGLLLGDRAWLATACAGAVVSAVMQMVALLFCAKLYEALGRGDDLRERFA